MKIALLSPIAWRTPPRHYGPWERVVSLLCEGLVERGGCHLLLLGTPRLRRNWNTSVKPPMKRMTHWILGLGSPAHRSPL